VGENSILICKCENIFLAMEWDGEELPANYVLEAQHCMRVSKAKKCYMKKIGGKIMSDVKWIKVAIGMFDDEKMKLIDDMDDRDTVHYVWIGLGNKLERELRNIEKKISPKKM
jgi:predicted phage-related endonuclease